MSKCIIFGWFLNVIGPPSSCFFLSPSVQLYSFNHRQSILHIHHLVLHLLNRHHHQQQCFLHCVFLAPRPGYSSKQKSKGPGLEQ